ncbi:hypothetical protein CVT24_005654 [Panaeolus cyanescens]|uniref:VLRF1 domain-containing protein n=1 Tax=Panaeolus cyanescens TaxID=181874 RepID=A0A409VBP9_9AGAR|nr:hypothetical protein CVT24_005654 [Panaeolus cyanescens]
MQSAPYNLFSLPPELLDSLTPRNLTTRAPIVDVIPVEPEPVLQNTSSGPRACNACPGIVFLDVSEQRNHFRSDWHRYNVKLKLKGGKPIAEAEFGQLLERLEDSLSGSASSDEDGSDSDAVNTLLNKTKRLTTRSPSPEASSTKIPLTALTWFHSPPSTQIGMYRAILPLGTEPEQYLQELKRLQTPVSEGRKWAMFMVAGGHFAGAIVRVSRTDEEDDEGDAKSRKKQKKPKPETEVLLHKTFHRYTTRRKQGGSQSTNDNAKGPAKSAGALLRRYGEQALREDIRGLLEAWSEELADCERIWIRASTSNKRIFYDYENAQWAKNDERLRTFPFPTRRPTQSELARCLLELTRPKITHYTEDELREQDEAYLASLPKPKPVPVAQPEPEKQKAKVVKLSKEEEILRDKWNRVLEMVTKGRLEPLKAFLERDDPSFGDVNTQIPEWTGEKRSTILQLAVVHGHEEMIRWLLEQGKADPTIPVISRSNDPQGDEDQPSDASETAVSRPKGTRVAYDLARTKAVRDIFRQCAGLHPDMWDWLGAGHVPSVYNQEKEDEKEEKKKVRRKGLKDRVKEREAKEKERPKTPPLEVKPVVKEPPASTGPRRLGGSSGATDGVAGLTPEMRMKVERERRARAAEARLKALGGSCRCVLKVHRIDTVDDHFRRDHSDLYGQTINLPSPRIRPVWTLRVPDLRKPPDLPFVPPATCLLPSIQVTAFKSTDHSLKPENTPPITVEFDDLVYDHAVVSEVCVVAEKESWNHLSPPQHVLDPEIFGYRTPPQSMLWEAFSLTYDQLNSKAQPLANGNGTTKLEKEPQT